MQKLAGVDFEVNWRDRCLKIESLWVFPERLELVGDVLFGLLVVQILIVEHRIRDPVFVDFEARYGNVINKPSMNVRLVFFERFEVHVPQRFRFLGCGSTTFLNIWRRPWRSINRHGEPYGNHRKKCQRKINII